MLLAELWRRIDEAALELFVERSANAADDGPIDPARDVVCVFLAVAGAFARAFGCPQSVFMAMAQGAFDDDECKMGGKSSVSARHLCGMGRGPWN